MHNKIVRKKNKLKKNKNDIIILYGPPWYGASQMSKHHFAKFQSINRNVLYIEAPINPLSLITRTKIALSSLKAFLIRPNKVQDKLWIASYFYLLPYRGSKFFFGARWVNKLNQWFVGKFLFKDVQKLKLNNPIIFVGGAHGYDLLHLFKENFIIYHCSDDYTFVPSFPDTFSNLEQDLFKKCNVVITTAEELTNAKSHFNSNIFTVPNGADIEFFLSTQNDDILIDNQIKKFDSPVIGYIGSVFDWLNKPWIKKAAEKYRDWNFVFIGPIETDILELENIQNIHFFGPREYKSLPKYLKGFSVATIPFIFNKVTLRASPIKFYEYLASGIPIVSSNLPDLKFFKNFAFLVDDYDSYEKALYDAVHNDNSDFKKKRMQISKKYSWDSRFKIIDQIIDDNL